MMLALVQGVSGDCYYRVTQCVVECGHLVTLVPDTDWPVSRLNQQTLSKTHTFKTGFSPIFFMYLFTLAQFWDEQTFSLLNDQRSINKIKFHVKATSQTWEPWLVFDINLVWFQ